MVKKQDKQEYLAYHITKFFKEYLPMVKGLSSNTICSYRDTFLLFLDYLANVRTLGINSLTVFDVDDEVVLGFLDSLENERGNAIATRNQRLTALRAFYSYLQKRELSCFELCSNIITIPNKKTATKTLPYFSVKEIELLVNMPDIKLNMGYRDYVLLLFMYETAARAQEIADFKIEQLYLNENNYVILDGKGNKQRRIPVSPDLSKLMKKYLELFELTAHDEVFFMNHQGEKLTTKGIEYILNKYVSKARIKYPDRFKQHYTNHCVRRSRAMHLLEAGVNIVYIRDFLGHSSVQSTEAYVRSNPIIKEKQIKQHSQSINAKKRYSGKQKKELLDFLKKL